MIRCLVLCCGCGSILFRFDGDVWRWTVPFLTTARLEVGGRAVSGASHVVAGTSSGFGPIYHSLLMMPSPSPKASARDTPKVHRASTSKNMLNAGWGNPRVDASQFVARKQAGPSLSRKAHSVECVMPLLFPPLLLQPPLSYHHQLLAASAPAASLSGRVVSC